MSLVLSADAEMVEMAREELAALNKELEELGDKLKVLLLPSDPLDEKNIMLEVGLHPPHPACSLVAPGARGDAPSRCSILRWGCSSPC